MCVCVGERDRVQVCKDAISSPTSIQRNDLHGQSPPIQNTQKNWNCSFDRTQTLGRDTDTRTCTHRQDRAVRHDSARPNEHAERPSGRVCACTCDRVSYARRTRIRDVGAVRWHSTLTRHTGATPSFMRSRVRSSAPARPPAPSPQCAPAIALAVCGRSASFRRCPRGAIALKSRRAGRRRAGSRDPPADEAVRSTCDR